MQLNNHLNVVVGLNSLKKFDSIVAGRNFHFLKGFWFRRNGNLDQAEQEFLKAYELDRDNYHVLRELARLLSLQGRYDEAEAFARSAFKAVPTNPFVIDVLCEIIIGKSQSSFELENNEEFHQLMRDLKKYSKLEELTFYENLMATYLFRIGNCEKALAYADEAAEKSSWRFGAFVTRANIRLGCDKVSEVAEDIRELRRIESDLRTGEGKAGRFQIDSIEIRYETQKGNYKGARQLLQKYREMPQFVREWLTKELAKTVAEDTRVDDPELLDWARGVLE